MKSIQKQLKCNGNKIELFVEFTLVPKETIHRRYLKLFYSKHETLKFDVRIVILGV